MARRALTPRFARDRTAAQLLDMTPSEFLALVTRFDLHANDVIFVAAQPVQHWGNVVNAITPSLLVTSVDAAVN